MKKCTSCGEMLDEKEFANNRSTPDGLANSCRSCSAIYHKAWRDKNRDKVSRATKEYRARNKERLDESIKAWRKKNKAHISELNRAWCKRNRTGSRSCPVDDPETDLVPMEAGGYVRWAVLTTDRRRAFGEQSQFNGQSVDIEECESGAF